MTSQEFLLILLLVVISLFPILQLNLFLITIIILILLLYVGWRWELCENSAQKVNFFSGSLSIIVLVEFILLLIFTLIILLPNEPIKSQVLNSTSTIYLANLIMKNPTGGISILIGLVSIITIYIYFFTVLGKTKYFSERSQIQEKYAQVFWRPFVLVFILGWIIFLFLFRTNSLDSLDYALIMIGTINLFFILGIPSVLKCNFYNLDLSNSAELKKGEYKYTFIEELQKEKAPVLENWTSDLILVMTFIWIGLSLFFNCNVFILLMAEYSLLIAHFWSSQLALIPEKKTTIELIPDNSGKISEITNVYILSESSNEYLIILDKNNNVSKIMKNSIYKLIRQKN